MSIAVERKGDGVVLLRIDRPEARNALSLALREEIATRFQAFADDPEVRCVVITGSDRVFAAGADIKLMANLSANEAMLNSTVRLWTPIKDFPKPLIAAVRGYALGGGCELAMHSDIVVAGEGAKFGQPEIRLGIMPGGGGTQRLVRAVGKYRAMKILLTGEPIGAVEAAAMGLVSEVVPDGETLPRALDLARRIATMPPIAARKIKEVVLSAADLPLDAALMIERQAMQLLFGTEDQREGMAAFIEKRHPNFKGR